MQRQRDRQRDHTSRMKTHFATLVFFLVFVDPGPTIVIGGLKNALLRFFQGNLDSDFCNAVASHIRASSLSANFFCAEAKVNHENQG
jgi:hypothetical protein